MKVSNLNETVQMLSEISREHAEEIAWELRHEDEAMRREERSRGYGSRNSYGGRSTPPPKVDTKPELTKWIVFTGVTDDHKALGAGLKQFKSGPNKGDWWFGWYSTSGKTALAKIETAKAHLAGAYKTVKEVDVPKK